MIGQVRRFNRTVTQRIGALDDAFLARDRPLGQARLLWEIGPDGCDIRDLRARLDLDSGYLSRLLRSLEGDGLVVVGPSAADGRVRTARLTVAGQAERAELDRRSDEAAAALLVRLARASAAGSIAAMAEVERLLTASAVQVGVRDPRHPDARYCLQAYFSELAGRFDGGFDPARSIPAADARDDPARRACSWSPACTREPVGLRRAQVPPRRARRDQADVGRPVVRGLGLGRRLLAELEARPPAHGVRAVRLETNRALGEAIGLYRTAGYREVAAFNDEPYAHHWFEKALPSSG